MAYCLRSFVQILDEVLHPDQHHRKWVIDQDIKLQVQSLWKTASFLRDFLDNSSPLIQNRIASLEDQIMDAAKTAEDTIESYISSQLLSIPEGQTFTISAPKLTESIQAFEDAKQEVIKIMDACQKSDESMPLSVSSTRYPSHSNVVGVTEDLNQLRSRLTSRSSELDIIPIVGMGGIGKTTLARILYDEHASRNSHFDCVAWVTVSQTYDPQVILKTLIACMPDKPVEHKDLIENLYKTLYGSRYLIVLDDVWSHKAWDDVQRAFPRDNKGSRIILTTRENILANYVNSKCHEMQLIEEDASWELLRGKVFGKESCPRDLEEVGKKIARSCGGLPLALQVIGGLISQSQKSVDFWEHVAYNVSSLIAETEDQFSGIFSWSFAHLPHYLKPCFLYLADFPEDYAIPASKIIKLWVAEGFLLPIRDKSLEEAARIHLNALVDRNLIFVREKKNNVKSFGIHDLLRDLCLRKAQEKEFIYVKPVQEDVFFTGRNVNVAARVHPPILTPLTRSFRSQDIGAISFNEFPRVILQLVILRYLHIRTWESTPLIISELRNLQTLIVNDITSLAMISNMPQLRHLKFDGITEEYSESLPIGVHENLQSLSVIPAREVRRLLGKLPNLRKLTIGCYKDDEFIDLTSFRNLENLYCSNGFSDGFSFYHNMIFPVSLKKLSLQYCKLGQSLLDATGELPNLEILVIDYCQDIMNWEPSEDGFCALQYLEIINWNLVNWLASEVHFPVLEHLALKYCDHLIEIPNEFGDIATLKIIEVDGCLPSVFDSATRIYEDQCQFGNTIQLRLGLGKDLRV